MSRDSELLAWAAAKIAAAQAQKIYGTVTFHVEAGTITRSETKSLEKPEGKRS
jgi:hypothetical protein